jgi:hypothetical protein
MCIFHRTTVNCIAFEEGRNIGRKHEGAELSVSTMCPRIVRWILICAVFVLTGCGPGLVFNNSQGMTSEQMLQRADHVFIGVVEDQQLQAWPFLRVPGDGEHNWAIARRRVRIEMLLRGVEPRKSVDVYEFYWTNATSGDWNAIQGHARCLFMVRTENGRYHVVRDWWRSILPIESGRHERLPLDDSHPFWERMALLQWWIQPDWSLGIGTEGHKDPGNALGIWRTIKIQRGLLRHPDPRLRRMACETLLLWGRSQDECLDDLSPEERVEHGLAWNGIVPAERGVANRDWEQRFAESEWSDLMSRSEWNRDDMDEIRMFTAVSNRGLRTRFCGEFQRRFPNDHDNGCPADQPPPATIVTEDGDVPLTGPWPVQK